MKKYLITGFSGFVSRHFLEYLENNHINATICGIDVQQPDFNTNSFINIKCDFIQIDLLNKSKIEEIIDSFGPDYVLHLASFSSVAFSWREPLISFNNNTNIYLNLLEAIRKSKKCCRILSIGSSEEYDKASESELPLTENHPLNPTSPYAVARVSQELLSNVYIAGYGLDIVCTRSFNHIGSYQKNVFVLASFASQLVKIKKMGKERGIITIGNSLVKRDFTDVRDVVVAYYLLLDKGKKGGVYNVCSGQEIILKDAVEKMANILKLKVDLHTDETLLRPNENNNIIGSNKKIMNEIGWQPRYSFEESLSALINYWMLKI